MRESAKIFLWPVYFDSTKTRSQGRRVPKKLAVPSPKLSDIQASLERMGFKCDVVSEGSYPRSPWRETGYITMSKRYSKYSLLKKVAEDLKRSIGSPPSAEVHNI